MALSTRFIQNRDYDHTVRRHERCLAEDLDLFEVEVDAAIAEIEGLDSDIEELAGDGWTDETVKGNADAIAELAGDGRTTETVKDNADAIIELAGDGRTVETVKGNADDIASLVSVVGDEQAGLVADVAALETTVGDAQTGLVADVDALQTTVGDGQSGLVADVDALEVTVGDAQSGLVADVDAAEADIAALKQGALDPKNPGLEGNQESLMIFHAYNIETGAASIKIYDANAPYRFEVVFFSVQARATAANGTMKLTNGTDDISNAVVCGTDKMVSYASSFDDAYSVIDENGTLEIVCAGDAVGDVQGIAVIGVIRRADLI